MSETYLHGPDSIEVNDGVRAIKTLRSSGIGIVGTAPDADAQAFPLNTPVLVAGNRTLAAKLDTVGDQAGTLPLAMDGIFDQGGAAVVVVRVEEGADEAATVTNVIGGAQPDGSYTGLAALRVAGQVAGLAPRILIAPGFSQNDAVATQLVSLADSLRAFTYLDAPGTTDAEAETFRGGLGTRRAWAHTPNHLARAADGSEVAVGASARVAGLRAKIDNDKGFWHSISNKPMFGIVGLTRPIGFAFGDANSQANLLNEKHIATTIREDGWRVWGARAASTSDSRWTYEAVVRTADLIADSVARAHRRVTDEPITPALVDDVLASVNGYLRSLKAQGAILGGRAFVDPELYTQQNITQGRLFVDFEFTPVYPAEQPRFRYNITDDYLEELVA